MSGQPNDSRAGPGAHPRYPLLNSRFLLPSWIIAGSVVVACVAFLGHDWRLYPMGDSYIHFVYARNLVEHHQFAYNPGWVQGIGTSSVLWVLVLAGFEALGVSPLIAGRVLGVGLLAIVGVQLLVLVESLLLDLPERRRIGLALILAVMVTANGNMVWIALSGMETILFASLGLASLIFYRKRLWIAAGVSLGLLTLTRIEGSILAVAIISVEAARRQMPASSWIRFLVPFVVLVTPWLLYLFLREGVPLPMSFQGKQTTSRAIEHLIAEGRSGLSPAMWNPVAIYLLGWLAYVLLYLSGGIALPGPSLSIPGLWPGQQLEVPFLSIALLVMAYLPAAYLLLRWLWGRARSVRQLEARHAVVVAICLWVVLHNLAYAVFLPQPGAAGRYAPMNHVLFWASLILVVGTSRRRLIRGALACMVGFVFLSSVIYWHQVYGANITYMKSVRLPAVDYVQSNCDPRSPVATTDLGPLRYFASQPILDIFGYVNKDILDVLRDGGSISEYLIRQGVECVYLFAPVDGVGVNLARALGLDADPRVGLTIEATYAVSPEVWELGAGAIGNYMPAIAIGRLEWRAADPDPSRHETPQGAEHGPPPMEAGPDPVPGETHPSHAGDLPGRRTALSSCANPSPRWGGITRRCKAGA
jgi:hypothetical protein